MFVTATAKEAILNKRKTGTLKHLVRDLVLEAKRLHVDETELYEMIKAAQKEEGNQ